MSLINHDTLSDNDNLQIPGYKLIRVDHPSNQKTRWYLYKSQILSPNKSKQCQLFKAMFKFQSEYIW